MAMTRRRFNSFMVQILRKPGGTEVQIHLTKKRKIPLLAASGRFGPVWRLFYDRKNLIFV